MKFRQIKPARKSALFQLSIKARAGLTLVELAIVIMVLSVLFTIMFSTYFGTARIVSASTPHSLARTQSLLALNLIQSSLNQTFFSESIDRVVFYGKSEGSGESRSDQISFATVFPGSEAVGLPAVREISYFLKREGPGLPGSLYRREDQNVDDHPYTGGLYYRILDNVQSFKLSYSLNGKDWVDNWSSKSSRRFPRLIRIEIIVVTGKQIEKYETLSSPGLYMY
ncbi:MAG: prepilin-type N-terminal cleavage/methylation domain-containing protein [Leptonema sp. (in: Bacteria)]|nr:prepilin-type N-terminal cleavage/methylation domain-containing protein [Leptonema sp. (in: bacteria)]